MHELNWLTGFHFQSLTRREYDWVFDFNGNTCIIVACLWRFLENGRIRITSRDDGHKFGLPTPIDAISEINSRLTDAIVSSVHLEEGVLDLGVQFGTKYSVQLIPDSSGYEAWHVCRQNQEFIAVGGGRLVVLERPRA